MHRAEQQGLGCLPVIPWHSHLDLAFPPGLFCHTGSSSNFETENHVSDLPKQKIRGSLWNGRGPIERLSCLWDAMEPTLGLWSKMTDFCWEWWDRVRNLTCFYAAENINAVTCFYSEPQQENAEARNEVWKIPVCLNEMNVLAWYYKGFKKPNKTKYFCSIRAIKNNIVKPGISPQWLWVLLRPLVFIWLNKRRKERNPTVLSGMLEPTRC